MRTTVTAHIIRSHRRLNLHHTIARYERLSLGVERMAIITSRDRMLAFRIMRVRINR